MNKYAQEEDQLMMSRLVWMTYLRPIFERIIKQMHDTMFEENFGKQQYIPQ